MMIESQRSVVFRPKLTNKSSMKYFLNSHRSMDNVILRNINMRMSKSVLDNFEFQRVKNVELGWKNSEGNIEWFLIQGCQYAESFTLAKFSLERISRGAISKVLAEINWKSLAQFKIVVITSNYKDTRSRKHLRNVTTMLKYVRIPALKELDFNFDFRYGFTQKHKLQYQKLFLGFYRFLVGHSKTLKMLTGRINTTSQCTVEIPEIPMDMQQSLVSNMKLEKFSLLLRGVRRLESILNPVLCGNKLEVLDFQILPSCRRRRWRWRWDLLQRAFNDNLRYNLQQIFERNGETLTNVSSNIYSLTFLSKCTALESLKLNILLQMGWMEPTDLSQLSHIKLKSFTVRYNNRLRFQESQELSPALLQLIRQSVGTLEHLSLFRTHSTHLDAGRPIQFLLSDCVALKSLKIDHIFEEYIEGVEFPHLTELETFPVPVNRPTTETWIVEAMRNLEIITIFGPFMDVQFLRTFLVLPKLRRIIFEDREILHGYDFMPLTPRHVIEEIKEFCAISGLILSTLEGGRKTGHFHKMHVITVHRATAVNPIIN